MKPKILVIRYSSFGDIVQCLHSVQALKAMWPPCEVDFWVRSDFVDIAQMTDGIHRVHALHRDRGLLGLIRQAWSLRGEGYTHIYDAHNNLRSWVASVVLRLFRRSEFVRRPKHRLRRFLLFRLRIPTFPRPTRGVATYLWPLTQWGVPPFPGDRSLWSLPQRPPSERLRLALVPVAAWELKQWPVERYKDLVLKIPRAEFWIFGGPTDLICEEIRRVAPDRCRNFAGDLTLAESGAKLAECHAVVGNDTGLTHVADGLGIPTVMLVGPSAFGHPIRETSLTAEVDLPCKPCSKDGRDRCRNSQYQKCLRDVATTQVLERLRELGVGV